MSLNGYRVQTMILRPLFFLFFLITSLYTAHCYAHPDMSIGTVVEVEGHAHKTDHISKKEEKLVFGSKISKMDIITTDTNARLLIYFKDDSELTIGEDAKLVIDEYVYDPHEAHSNKAHYSFLRGAFLMVSGLLNKDNDADISVKTPYGSIGIRGTKFWGGTLKHARSYEDNSRTAGQKHKFGVFVEDGRVEFKTKQGSQLIDAGFGSFTDDINSVPTAPKIWSDVDIQQALSTVTLKNNARALERIKDLKTKRD